MQHLTSASLAYYMATMTLIVLVAPPVAAQSSESVCFGQVQGRIAWNYEGNKNWNQDNIQLLCRGTSNAPEPGRCFDRTLHGEINWGRGTQWETENAINLCAGTNNADRTIDCFQRNIEQGNDWPDAIRVCERSAESLRAESLCFAQVQDLIAWDYEENRKWNPANIQLLCRGTVNASEPGRCFDRTLHGGINWGNGTHWEWENAIALCTGTNDADQTIDCFQQSISQSNGLEAAILSCRT